MKKSFWTVLLGMTAMTGALREKATRLGIKWNKNRGKDVASAPWFALFHGDCLNDHHTTLAEQKAARGEG